MISPLFVRTNIRAYVTHTVLYVKVYYTLTQAAGVFRQTFLHVPPPRSTLLRSLYSRPVSTRSTTYTQYMCTHFHLIVFGAARHFHAGHKYCRTDASSSSSTCEAVVPGCLDVFFVDVFVCSISLASASEPVLPEPKL